MRRYISFLLSFIACFLASIGFSGVPVNVTTVKKLTPVDVYFTGKVESVESGTLGFGVDRGVVAETKKVGDIVEPNELVALTGGQKGTVGQGYSYSPHIHYELEVGDKKVNPIPDAEKYWRIKK